MIQDFKLTRNSILPTKYSAYRHLKPETDKLKQLTYRTMHHKNLKRENSKTYQENDRGDGRKVFGNQGTLELSLESAEEWSMEKFKTLVFRVSCEDDGVRKKKRKTSKVLYKFVSGIKKM